MMKERKSSTQSRRGTAEHRGRTQNG
jgi:hypothetical protein